MAVVAAGAAGWYDGARNGKNEGITSSRGRRPCVKMDGGWD